MIQKLTDKGPCLGTTNWVIQVTTEHWWWGYGSNFGKFLETSYHLSKPCDYITNRPDSLVYVCPNVFFQKVAFLKTKVYLPDHLPKLIEP